MYLFVCIVGKQVHLFGLFCCKDTQLIYLSSIFAHPRLCYISKLSDAYISQHSFNCTTPWYLYLVSLPFFFCWPFKIINFKYCIFFRKIIRSKYVDNFPFPCVSLPCLLVLSFLLQIMMNLVLNPWKMAQGMSTSFIDTDWEERRTCFASDSNNEAWFIMFLTKFMLISLTFANAIYILKKYNKFVLKKTIKFNQTRRLKFRTLREFK